MGHMAHSLSADSTGLEDGVVTDMKALLREAAEEIRASVEAEYGHSLEYPSYRLKYDAGMELPAQLEAAAEALGEPVGWCLLVDGHVDHEFFMPTKDALIDNLPYALAEDEIAAPLYLAPPPAVQSEISDKPPSFPEQSAVQPGEPVAWLVQHPKYMPEPCVEIASSDYHAPDIMEREEAQGWVFTPLYTTGTEVDSDQDNVQFTAYLEGLLEAERETSRLLREQVKLLRSHMAMIDSFVSEGVSFALATTAPTGGEV